MRDLDIIMLGFALLLYEPCLFVSFQDAVVFDFQGTDKIGPDKILEVPRIGQV